MKAQDLMIGDWVYGIDGKGGKHPCRINTIDIYPQNRTPRVVTSGGYGYQQENLEPIPLTPEILEKNEWCSTMNGTGEFYLKEPLVNAAIVTKTIMGFQMNHGPFSGLSIHFVHELQHALRLCGIEKEIVI